MALAMTVMLPIQFILGMILNLYVKFPDTTDQAKLWDFARTNGLVLSHIILGLVLLVVSIILLIKIARYKMRPLTILATIGLLGILVAIYGGEEFVKTQSDAYSLVMALGFIVAGAVYGRLMGALMMARSKLA